MSDQELKEDNTLSPSNAGLNSNEADPSDIGSTGNNSKERRKIEIKFIENKTRRHVTFSKRKHGIMKKAFELSVLTGTQVLLLVVSETGLVYTFSTPKFEPIVTQQEGRNLIQACLNAPDEEEEEEEEEDEEAQRQRLAVQSQQQLQQQAQQQAQQAQQIQQAQQQVQQHQAAMQSVPPPQQQQQQQPPQQQQQPPQQPPNVQNPATLPNGQITGNPNQLHQLQQVAGDNQHPFSMDGFATPGTNQATNPTNNNVKQDPSAHPQATDDDVNNNNQNNPNNPVYQQYFQSSQQPAQF